MDPELRTMLITIIVFLAAGVLIITLAVPRCLAFSDRVSSYSANMEFNGGRFTVSEDWTFVLTSDKHLIYRNWDAKVSLVSLDEPHVRIVSISCPAGAIPYFADSRGINFMGLPFRSYEPKFYYYVDGRWVSEEDALSKYPALPVSYVHMAEKPEVGCVSTSGILPAGTYEMRVRFVVYPPLNCDDRYCHANIALAGDDHFPYSSVHVSLNGNDIVDVIQRPPSWFLSLVGLRGDERLEYEFLLELINDYPFIRRTTNVLGKFNAVRGDPHFVEHVAYVFFAFLLVLLPILLFLYWYFFARDRPDPSVPEFLTNVPNPDRKPWIVNAVFDGSAGVFDPNAFAATVMDLERKGCVRVTGEGEDVTIELLPCGKDLDEYERAVYEFMRDHSVGDAFIPSVFANRVKNASEGTFGSLKREWEELTGRSPIARKVARKFIYFPSEWLTISIGALAALSFIVFYVSGDFFFIISTFYFAALAWWVSRLPPDVLGRWKNGYGREYTQWQAFKRFLSDLTLIRKYSEQFRSMWQDWLIYGTALGVADKVMKAIKEIHIPDADTAINAYYSVRLATDAIRTAYIVKAAEIAAANAARGAGGFGAGGGFGGGGGGAR